MRVQAHAGLRVPQQSGDQVPQFLVATPPGARRQLGQPGECAADLLRAAGPGRLQQLLPGERPRRRPAGRGGCVRRDRRRVAPTGVRIAQRAVDEPQRQREVLAPFGPQPQADPRQSGGAQLLRELKTADAVFVSRIRDSWNATRRRSEQSSRFDIAVVA